MPDIENNRKTAPKGAEWVPGKDPAKQLKNDRNIRKIVVLMVSVLVTGKYGCRQVRVYPAECSEQLGSDPSKMGVPNPLF